MTFLRSVSPRGKRDSEARQQYLRALGCIFLCALATVVPLTVHGNSFGHDFDFHLLSWMETAKQWHEGIVYPHWIASANFGAGEPRFLFYPPASWMLGAALGALTSWTAAPILFIMLSLFFSGASLYSLAREYMPREAATLAACVYAMNPYALFNAYERAAYGELLAGMWMPLIVLFALRRRASIVPLALTVAGIWLTNAPAAVMACYTLAGVAAPAAITERKPWLVVRAACGGLLGIGLASFYLVPAAYERRWVQIARAIGPGMRIEDSFLFAHAGEPDVAHVYGKLHAFRFLFLHAGESFHTAVLLTVSWVAVTLLVVAAIALVLLWRGRAASERSSDTARSSVRTLLAASAAITIVILFLLLPWSAALWRVAPEMRFLQFPWRWLLVESVVVAVLVGLASAAGLSPKARQADHRGFAILCGTAIILCVAMFAFYQPEDEDDTLASQVAAFRSGTGAEGTDEYTPANADNSAIQKNLPMVRLLPSPDAEVADSTAQVNPEYQRSAEQLSAEVAVNRWRSQHKVVQVTTERAGFAVLRLMDYPGWRVLVNSSVQTLRPQRADGLMVVPLPAGVSRIEVSWQDTQDAMWGRVATFASLFLLIPIALLERKKDQAAQV